MNAITANGHEEKHFARAMVMLVAHDRELLGNAEFEVLGKVNKLTFNDMYLSYLDKEGEYHYRELNGWRIRVYPIEETEPEPKTLEEKQITFFDILGG